MNPKTITVTSHGQEGGKTAGIAIDTVAVETVLVVGQVSRNGTIGERWTTAAYAQTVREDGYRIVGVGAHEEWERLQQGWDHLLVTDTDGSSYRLKIADPSVPGGFMVLLKKRVE